MGLIITTNEHIAPCVSVGLARVLCTAGSKYYAGTKGGQVGDLPHLKCDPVLLIQRRDLAAPVKLANNTVLNDAI
jgi:hypothetical protein